MLICTCPSVSPNPEECIALGSGYECLPWCDYLKEVSDSYNKVTEREGASDG